MVEPGTGNAQPAHVPAEARAARDQAAAPASSPANGSTPRAAGSQNGSRRSAAAGMALDQHLQQEADSAAAAALRDLDLEAGQGGPAAPQDEPPDGLPKRASGSVNGGGSVGDSVLSEAGTDSSAPERVNGFSTSGHYDATQDVILRAEYLTERDFRVGSAMVQIVVLVGWAVLLMLLVLKLTQDDSWWFRTNFVSYFNVIAATICLAGALACYGIFVNRLVSTWRSGKRWSHRRRRGTMIRFVEITVLLVNLASWLAPNAYILNGSCRWFARFIIIMGGVQWTTWNTLFLIFVAEASQSLPLRKQRGNRKEQLLVMDAPWLALWPLLVLWALYEGLLIACCVHVANTRYGQESIVAQAGAACDAARFKCNPDTTTVALTSALVGLWVIYLLVWAVQLTRTLRFVRERPYNDYKMANFIVRLQVRRLLWAVGFFVTAMVLLYYVKISSCASFCLSWLGLGPLHIVETAVVLSGVYVYMPKDPDLAGPVLQVWLQQFAWTVDDYVDKMRKRLERLPQHAEQLACEPMFCFEAAIKNFYWSCLVYDYDEVRGGTRFSVEVAMRIYGLRNFELLWEHKEDTKVIMGWSNKTIVLAFRGTASVTNVLADIQAWRTPYPPTRGGCWGGLLGRQPLVHSGFVRSWQANGFNRKLLDRIKQLIDSGEVDRTKLHIKVTGHSLGGALATLAAFEIRRALPWLGCLDVGCYTFGAPRTGNHAFAREYNRTVPNTWHIINDQDVVARGGKFLVLYKRPGQRVIINQYGDLLVRPSFAEMSINLMPFGARVSQHFLVSYRRALMAVMSAQFGRKGFSHGVEGVRRLLERCHVRDLLLAAPAGVAADVDLLDRLAGLGGTTAAALGGRVRRAQQAAVGAGSAESTVDNKCEWCRPQWASLPGHRHSLPSRSAGRRQSEPPAAADVESVSSGDDKGIEVEHGELRRSAEGRDEAVVTCHEHLAPTATDSQPAGAPRHAPRLEETHAPSAAGSVQYRSFQDMVHDLAGLPLSAARELAPSEASLSPRAPHSGSGGLLDALRHLHLPPLHSTSARQQGGSQHQSHPAAPRQRDDEDHQHPPQSTAQAGPGGRSTGPGRPAAGLAGSEFCLVDSDSDMTSLGSATSQERQPGPGSPAGLAAAELSLGDPGSQPDAGGRVTTSSVTRGQHGPQGSDGLCGQQPASPV